MSYLEVYLHCVDLSELKDHITSDINIAVVLGNNPDILKKIAVAAEEAIKQKGWEDLI